MTWRWSELTDREKEIALMAAKGYKDDAIALRLGVGHTRVTQCLQVVFRMLSVCNRAEMAFVIGQHLKEIEQAACEAKS